MTAGAPSTVEQRSSVGTSRPIRYRITANHTDRARAEGFADTYLDTIVDAIVNHPRSQQRRIGPSEMGIDCRRALLHKLNQDPEPDRGDIPWKPTQGTALHAWLEDVFATAARGAEQSGRWLVEQRVTVGDIAGTPITGSVDLFDTWQGVVADHKNVGRSTLKKYRAHGPSNQYRTQAHLYGRGFTAAGHDVRMVAICFLPREGELDDTYIWTEPYDEQVALAALDRCNQLASLLAALGIDQATALYEPCTDRWCRWCGTGNSFGARPLAASTADLFTTATN